MTSPALLKPEMFAALKLSDFVAIDIETTGLDYLNSDIVEVAAVHFRDGQALDRFSRLLKPDRPIPEFITRITGITDEEVADAPPFAAALPEIREFVGEYPLVAHNAPFDLGFLEYHSRRVKGNFADWNAREKAYHYFPNPQLDTLPLSRIYLPFLPAFGLSSLSDYFQFPREKEHRALPDAEAAGNLFLEILYIAVKTKFSDIQKIMQILEPNDEPLKTFFQNLLLFLADGKYSVPEGIDRKQFSINANLYNIIGEDTLPEFATEEVQPIDEEEMAGFFDKEGELAREFRTFEIRSPQVAMARAVARAFNRSSFSVIEAGTGTGKSLAYLVPAIQWAVQNYGPLGRVIVSTNTKNLQEQLFFKDLPILRSITKEKFKAVLLKGKGNYLCLDKWVTVMSDLQHSLNAQERMKILPLYFWVQETKTGDIAENHGFKVEKNLGLWSKFIAENNYCPGKTCKYYDRCFLMKARNQARNAHLVLVNHSLLFSDLAADNAVLDDYANVIFDEAHNIEKTATNYLGVEATLWQFRDFLKKLYSKEKFETGILARLRRRVAAGDIKPEHLESLLRMIDRLIEKIAPGRQLVQQFFSELTSSLRLQVPQSDSGYSSRHRYLKEDRLFDPLKELHREIQSTFDAIKSGLHDLVEYFQQLPENSFEQQRQLYQDLKAQLMQAQLLMSNLEFVIRAEWDNFVYWFEIPARENSFDTRLYAAPLDIGGILSEKLYGKLNTAIFTSATLAVDRRFDYFIKRTGIEHLAGDRVETLLLDSPFRYTEQVFLGVPAFLPDPNSPQFSAAVKALLKKMVQKFPLGTLTLFTSYAMLNNVYRSVRQTFEAENVLLLGQGIDGGRHALMNRFKAEESSFLFGTDSFWEGVDVPGRALEMVLITKLPFDVPSDPIIQAKSELIKKKGGNPFMEFAIPEAVIRLRQGFGRLIRHQSDYGGVIILDTRVVKKFYGRIFLQSLPLRPRILAEEEALWSSLEQWFR